MVLYFVCSGKGMVYRICFDVFYYSVWCVKWDKCKLFKIGFFFCFLVDGFYSFLFVIVENCDLRDFYFGEFEV